MKFAFYTLGCKVNQCETQAMEHRLRQLGQELGRWEEVCDGYLINTCTVTAVSDRKSRTAIRQARRRNPDAVIGVCGCYSQTKPEEVRALDVDVLAGTADRMAFLEAVVREAAERRRQKLELWERAAAHRQFEALPAGGLAARTRAMLKAEDGCANYCTYCVIPYARGPVRSLPAADAAAEAARLAAEGYRELVVTGIELSSWGRDLPGRPGLASLLTAVCRAAPALRVRLGSLEPRTVTEEFCAALAACPGICPQFHLSMQSGCDAVLSRMGRKYDTARFARSVALLRQYWPGCAVTTDWIVGFPGETEAEFRQSLDFVARMGFSQVHVFPYSRRAGTAAAAMPGQLSRAEKARRAEEAGRLAAALSESYRRGLIGSTVRVLFEQAEDGWDTGHGENYVKVYVPAAGRANCVETVRVTELFADGVRGTVEPRASGANHQESV